MPLKTLKYFVALVRLASTYCRCTPQFVESSRASSLSLLNGMQNLLEYSVMPLMPKGEI